MRIALVSFAFDEYAVRLASGLTRHADVGLWLPEVSAAPHLHKLAPTVEYRAFPKTRMRHLHKQIPLMRRLVREIRDFAPDVLHIQQGHFWFNPTLRLLADIPLVVTVHDPVSHVGDKPSRRTPQIMHRLVFRQATQLIVHNEQMQQAMASQGAEPTRLNIVPTVVRGHEEVATAVNEEDGAVLFFGRIWEYKGLDYLIRAEPLVSERVPHARFIIAGAGEDFSTYQRMMVNVDRFEVHNRYVPNDEVPSLFRRASVVALPYIDATQSGVIVTAYNFGRPVVATTVGGLPSMVEHGRTGLLVRPRDERALADAIVRLLSDDDLRRSMGAQAKKRALEEFSASSVAERTVDVYRRAIDR